MGLQLAATADAIDSQVCRFIDHAWEEGEPKGLVGDLMSGLAYFIPAIRNKLNASWRLHQAWTRNEMLCWADPLPKLAAVALAGLALKAQCCDVAVSMLVAFHCFLRTAEMRNLTVGDVLLGHANRHTTVVLSRSQTGLRKGIQENVSVTDPMLVAALVKVMANRRPGERLMRCSGP